MSQPPNLVLYDGQCGFCRWCVGWARRRDVQGRLEFVPYQDCPSPPMTPELSAACERALHVITPEGVVVTGGRAVLAVLERLGHPTTAGVLGMRPLVWGVEAGYRLVSANRRHLGRWLSAP